MKNALLKSSLFSIIIAFWSCGIDEPQIKPDYTLAGKQMFDKTELHVTMLTEWMDVLLKMNTYIQANDADKMKIEDKYFPNYKIRNSAVNTWSLIDSGDTICKIFTDGNPFTAVGANWGIKYKNMEIPCPFSCVSASLWMMKVTNFKINQYNEDDFYPYYSNDYSVETYMSDSVSFASDNAIPEDFATSNFELSGKGEFLRSNNTQDVKIVYTIDKNLKHVANSTFNMNSGKYILSAEDLQTAKKGVASAEFEILIGNTKKITVVYNGRTQTYPTNNQSIILN